MPEVGSGWSSWRAALAEAARTKGMLGMARARLPPVLLCSLPKLELSPPSTPWLHWDGPGDLGAIHPCSPASEPGWEPLLPKEF